MTTTIDLPRTDQDGAGSADDIAERVLRTTSPAWSGSSRC